MNNQKQLEIKHLSALKSVSILYVLLLLYVFKVCALKAISLQDENKQTNINQINNFQFQFKHECLFLFHYKGNIPFTVSEYFKKHILKLYISLKEIC